MNHMTADFSNDDVGSGGLHADTLRYIYPVPYSDQDFNLPKCTIHDWGNATQVIDYAAIITILFSILSSASDKIIDTKNQHLIAWTRYLKLCKEK